MKKRLIVFPGFLDGVFCINEMPFITSHFDEVVYFTYPGDISKYNNLAKKNNIRFIVINNFEFKNVIEIFLFFFKNWKCVKQEILLVLRKGGNIKILLKRTAYMLLYISFAINADIEYSKIIDNHYVDTVYSFWFTRGAFASTYLKIKYNLNNAFSRAHGYDLYEERNDVNYLPFRQYILENISYVFSCSLYGVDYLSRLYPKLKIKIICSYLGTKDYGISLPSIDGKFRLVTCSSIIPVKRVMLLAKALKIIDQSGLGDKFKWICFGDGPLLSQIKNYTEHNIKNINIEFMGNKDNKFIMNYYSNHNVDLFINTSSSEGVPVSIMEAISFGIPVMATDVGGSKEVVQDGVTGVLLKSDISAEELSKKIVEFYKNNNLKRDNIRNYWNSHFRDEKNYNELFNIISS